MLGEWRLLSIGVWVWMVRTGDEGRGQLMCFRTVEGKRRRRCRGKYLERLLLAERFVTRSSQFRTPFEAVTRHIGRTVGRNTTLGCTGF